MGSGSKIALVASSGGHRSQLLKLSEAWRMYDVFHIVTTGVVQNSSGKQTKMYVVGECNRQHPLKVITVMIRCLKIFLREKPGAVISTGAAVGCISCYIGKLMGAKVIWLDSITNVERISLSGRMVRHIADLFLVQWPELAQKYSNVEYAGEVI